LVNCRIIDFEKFLTARKSYRVCLSQPYLLGDQSGSTGRPLRVHLHAPSIAACDCSSGEYPNTKAACSSRRSRDRPAHRAVGGRDRCRYSRRPAGGAPLAERAVGYAPQPTASDQALIEKRRRHCPLPTGERASRFRQRLPGANPWGFRRLS
jgi:hypothetical protein